MTVDNRAGFIAGLRTLATILEQNPDLPLPYDGATTELLWIATGADDHKAMAQTFARLIPGQVRKNVRGTDFDLIGAVDGLKVQLIVDRDAVCERVVVGTEQVTIPAKPAAEAEPERVEEREVIEWRCQPILGIAAEVSA